MKTRSRQTQNRWQRYRRAVAFSPLLLTAVMPGCGKDTVRHVEAPQPAIAPPAVGEVRYPSLAGTWEYEENGKTILITLNEEGRGTYEWKDGEFITTTYSRGLWRGIWFQRENDRAGGFEVILREGRSEGEGHWWYTRIGTDTAPTQPGGLFQIARPVVSEVSDHDGSDGAASLDYTPHTHPARVRERK